MPAAPARGRYAHLDFNAPLSSARADALAETLGNAKPASVLDIGCGWAELLLRVLAAAPRATGRGIDTDAELLARARANAASHGLTERTTFLEARQRKSTTRPTLSFASAPTTPTEAKRTPSTRSTSSSAHAANSSSAAASGNTNPPPSRQPLSEWNPAHPDLARLVDLAIAPGFRPLKIETANQDESDAFESGYLADWEHWLHQTRSTPQAEEIRAKADTHRTNWLSGYRTALGFAYLTLGRPDLDLG
jgi:SAM-dependent methyltransferase